MGAKYTTQAASGYNSSPPPDDGSQVAANLISWSTIKTKLADPVKTLDDNINTALVSAFDYSVRQITSSDNTVAGDHMRCVEIAPTVTTAVTVSLGDAATMTNVYRVFVKNSSAINQTLGRVTGGDTLDGTAANVTLAPGEGRVIQTINAATGYVTVARFGPFVDSGKLVVGSSDGTKAWRVEVDGFTTATTRVFTPPDADLTLPAVTAKGDIISASASGVMVKTAVGTDGQSLIANSAASGGVSWSSIGGVLGTEQATTSGSSIDFTGIPSSAKLIILMLSGVSSNGTSDYVVQLGDAGGIENTGYLSTVGVPDGGSVSQANGTTGFIVVRTPSVATTAHGMIILAQEDSSDNTWTMLGMIARSDAAAMYMSAGAKATSATLDRVRLTVGSDSFDAGAVNLLYF